MDIRLRMTAAAMLMAMPGVVLAATQVMVHRDPGCGCCAAWAAQVRAAFGAEVRIVDDPRRPALQAQAGVPTAARSCHTATIEGITFEGHVPIADMKRVLAQRPAGVSGLAVAGMPAGSPGMEVPGVHGAPYDVIAFGTAGTHVYAHHG